MNTNSLFDKENARLLMPVNQYGKYSNVSIKRHENAIDWLRAELANDKEILIESVTVAEKFMVGSAFLTSVFRLGALSRRRKGKNFLYKRTTTLVDITGKMVIDETRGVNKSADKPETPALAKKPFIVGLSGTDPMPVFNNDVTITSDAIAETPTASIPGFPAPVLPVDEGAKNVVSKLYGPGSVMTTPERKKTYVIGVCENDFLIVVNLDNGKFSNADTARMQMDSMITANGKLVLLEVVEVLKSTRVLEQSNI